jgi:hypothetical protein
MLRHSESRTDPQQLSLQTTVAFEIMVTWRRVRRAVNAYCLGCHTRDGTRKERQWWQGAAMAGKIRHQTERMKACGKERQWPARSVTKRNG